MQTVTTVGYGNPTPTGTGGQVLALFLMLLGTAFVAVITAAVTSVSIERPASHPRVPADRYHECDALEDIRVHLEGIERALGAMRRYQQDQPKP